MAYRTGRLLDRDITKEVPASQCQGAKFIWVDPVPEDLIQGEIEHYAKKAGVLPSRIPAYGLGEWGQEAPQEARDNEIILMHCHGGAYVTRTAHPEDMTAGIPKGFVKFGKQTITRAISIEYRISRSAPWAPSSPFPTALIDGLSGYYYLIKVLGFKSQNIVISGDSAGGNLALALVRYLRDNPQIGLGLPGGLLLVSPWSDLSGTHRDHSPHNESINSSKNEATSCDYLAGDFDSPHSTVGYGRRSLLGNISDQDARKNAYINPASLELEPQFVSTMFNDFPPTYIVYGDAEVLVDEIRTLYERMANNIGVKAVKDEVPDAIHDFPAFDFWEPEYSQTHQRIATWLSSLR